MKKTLLSIMLIGIIAFIASSWTFTNVPGHKTIIFEEDYDNSALLSGSAFNDCAGEVIDFSGYVHDWGTVVGYDDGSLHQNWHFNYSNFTGVGQTSGTTYHFLGAGHFNINNNLGSVTVITQFGNITGQGMGAVSKFKGDFHVVVNANGDIVVEHNGFSFACQ